MVKVDSMIKKNDFDSKNLKETIWKLNGDRNLVKHKVIISTALVNFLEMFIQDSLSAMEPKEVTLKKSHIIKVLEKKYKNLKVLPYLKIQKEDAQNK